VGSTAYFAMVCAGMGLLSGVRVLVAQATGANEPERAHLAAWQGIIIALAVAVVVMLSLLFSGPALTLMAGSGQLGELARQYFDARLFGVFGALVGIAALGWFEGRGETRLPMHIRVWTNLVNVGVSWALIYGVGPFPEMGVAGAGLGTAISLTMQGVIGIAFLWRRTGGPVGFCWDGFGELLRLGGPMGVQWALEVQSWAIFTALVARVGDAHMAAHTIVVRIISVSFLPGHAVGDAAGILCGQAHGAGDMWAARRASRSSLELGLLVMGLLGVGFLVAPDLALSAFAPTDEVMAIGKQLLAIGAGFQILDAVCMVRTGALNGIGDTRYVMTWSVGLSWVSLVPLAWCLSNGLGWGAPGAWLGLSVYIGALGILLSGRWSQLTGATLLGGEPRATTRVMTESVMTESVAAE
jgi:MATE family multidrug resistance protein